MKSCLGLLGLFAVLEVVFVGLGVGIGFLLNWLMPSIGLGSGSVVGVVATAISLYGFARIVNSFDVIDDPATEVIVDSPTQAFIASLDTLPARGRRKRKTSH